MSCGLTRNRLMQDMDILQACCKPLTITHILYTTKINCAEIYKRLEFLEQKGFVTITEKDKKTKFASHNSHRVANHALSTQPHNFTRRIFETTESGRSVLKLWNTFFSQYKNGVKNES